MSEHSDNSMLSAFLDGELTAEERQALEVQLESSESLRGQLEELRQLSAMVSALPTESAPADLQSSVMASLPAKPAPAAPTPKSGLPPRGVMAMVTAAAVVLVMVWRFSSDTRTADTTSDIARTESAAESADTAFLQRSPAASQIAQQPADFNKSGGLADQAGAMADPAEADDSVEEPGDNLDSVTDHSLAELARSIEGSEVAMISVRTQRRDVRKLLDIALAQDKLVAAKSDGKPAAGMEAVVVHVRFDQVASVLEHVADHTGRNSLAVYDVRSQNKDLRARLDAALASDVDETGQGQVASRSSNAETNRSGGNAGGAKGAETEKVEIASGAAKPEAGGKNRSTPASGDVEERAVAANLRLVFLIPTSAEPVDDPCVDDA